MPRKPKGEVAREARRTVRLDTVELQMLDVLRQGEESDADVFRRVLEERVLEVDPDFFARHATAAIDMEAVIARVLQERGGG